MKKAVTTSAHPKKEFKKELVSKIETVLADLKSMLGEEEFQHRLKKAAKVLAHGLHGKDFQKNTEPDEAQVKLSPKKIKGIKKAVAKKANLKKAVATKA